MDFEAIDKFLIDACNDRSLAGLAAGIVKDGCLVYTKCLGMADSARGIPIAPSTVFRICSISKTVTAIAVMQLHEQGRFQLDDPIAPHLRSFKIEQRPGDKPITFRHLLTHTAGIGEFRKLGDIVRPTLGLSCKPGIRPALREYYAPALKAEVGPGEKWSYANHGIAALGQLVEDISGRPFADYMRKNVFDLLGMDHSDYNLTDRVRDAFAQGYRLKRRGMIPIPYREIIPGAAGSIFSSIQEMEKYVAALLAGGVGAGGRIIKAETLASMLTPQYQLDARMPQMGLAFMLGRAGDIRVAGHNGGWTGFTTAMWLAPDHGVGVLLFTNTTTLPLDPISFGMLSLAVRGTDAAPRPAILEQPALWGELCGTYRPASGFGTNFRLWMIGGALKALVRQERLRITGRIPFGPVHRGLELRRVDENDPLVYEAEFRGIKFMFRFKRNSSGRVDSMDVAAIAGVFMTLYKGASREG
ncbi:MAG TPA: serine hydrolase domain-containing protein [Candidatus Binataceae bacterium]|nr:serine hydrolase domain-containing protein [Candidatus Binataceae bacterium]